MEGREEGYGRCAKVKVIKMRFRSIADFGTSTKTIEIPTSFKFHKQDNRIDCWWDLDVDLRVLIDWIEMNVSKDSDIIEWFIKTLNIHALAKFLAKVLRWDFNRWVYPVGVFNYKSSYNYLPPSPLGNVWVVVGSPTRGFIIELIKEYIDEENSWTTYLATNCSKFVYISCSKSILNKNYKEILFNIKLSEAIYFPWLKYAVEWIESCRRNEHGEKIG